jgi:putative transposase
LLDQVRDRLADEVIDELLPGARTEEEIVGPGGVLAQLTKRLVERAMSAELTEHLGYEPHQEPPGGAGNTRNGSTPKTLATEHGPVDVRTPRDRKGTFEPQIVRKEQRRFQGSTTRSSRFTRAACRRAISRRTWRRSTGSRWAAT